MSYRLKAAVTGKEGLHRHKGVKSRSTQRKQESRTLNGVFAVKAFEGVK